MSECGEQTISGWVVVSELMSEWMGGSVGVSE